MSLYTGHGSYGGRGDYGRRVKNKAEWAGISLADAFRNHFEYYTRLQAARMFHREASRVQRAVARVAGENGDEGFEPAREVQLSIPYTNYPASLAAYAALGHTGIVEYLARLPKSAVALRLEPYLAEPAQYDELEDLVDREAYRKIAKEAGRAVEVRLLLRHLGRHAELSSIEYYRLFLAAIQGTDVPTVPSMLRAVVTYGDVLPAWARMELHPLTHSILDALTRASTHYFDLLETSPEEDLYELALPWTVALCRALAPFLPTRQEEEERRARGELEKMLGASGGQRSGLTMPSEDGGGDDDFAPLEGRHRPPSLFDPPNLEERLRKALQSGLSKDGGRFRSDPSESKAATEAVRELTAALEQAGANGSNVADIRGDVVEQALRGSAFEVGPLQGSLAEGHEVEVDLGDDTPAAGEVHDVALPPAEDVLAVEKLRREAEPITCVLRQALYPSVEQLPVQDRLRESGRIDAQRLPLAGVSAAVFQRYRFEQRPDPRGRPVLCLICDASGSLNPDRMRTVKLLTGAWLDSTVRSQVQVLAGMYHQGPIRQGMSGNVVRWLFHPEKTPTLGRRDAIRAVATAPDRGSGGQADALQVAFMLDEAARLARGRNIYAVHLSDCGWCSSFRGPRIASTELLAMYRSKYEALGDRLHVTLVALDRERYEAFEDVLDEVLPVPGPELGDPAAVAARIGKSVAESLRARRRLAAAR